MSVQRHDIEIPRLPEKTLADWATIPASVASDCQQRSMAMIGAISPLAPTMRIVGQARTIKCMASDNSALHAAISLCVAGDVLVCDAQGFEDSALWGGLLTRSAVECGIQGLVIDGAVRDSVEIVKMGFPCFARAVVPRGPHKSFGGVIDGPIACGGVTVASGDLIIGDYDGVTVVPFLQVDDILNAAKAVLEKEERALAKIAEGGSLTEIYGIPEIILK